MRPTTIALLLCAAAALTSIPSHAGEHRKKAARRHAPGMKAIPVRTADGEPGHGWRYFSDPRDGRAVVITPGGDYYYGQGESLRLVYKANPTA